MTKSQKLRMTPFFNEDGHNAAVRVLHLSFTKSES